MNALSPAPEVQRIFAVPMLWAQDEFPVARARVLCRVLPYSHSALRWQIFTISDTRVVLVAASPCF